MVTLVDSQSSQLGRWQEKFNSLSDRQSQIDNDLKSCEDLPSDVDGAKKQALDLKVTL